MRKWPLPSPQKSAPIQRELEWRRVKLTRENLAGSQTSNQCKVRTACRDRKNLGVFLVWEIQGLSSSGQKLCLFKGGGAKVQVTGHRSGHRLQVTGHRSGYRPQVRSQVTGHRSGHRSQKTIGHWTKLFWTDVLLYKNKISQGTLMIFLSFKQY